MSPVVIGLIGIAVLLLLLFLEVHIGVAMAVVGVIGFICLTGWSQTLNYVGMLTYPSMASYDIYVLPLFICMGLVAAHTGMATELYGTAHKWIGSFRGGLAMATVAACAGFAAVSGTSVGTALTIGPIALPEMKKFGYSDQLATGTVAAGGTLGILIPPSTVMVLYGILTEQSVGKLLIAGIIPGIILSALFLAAIALQCWLDPSIGPAGPKTTWKDKMVSLKGTLPTLILFLVVMGGLWFGIFTPSEAGGIGAAGAIIIGLVRRKLKWPNFRNAMIETMKTTGMLIFILIGAYTLNAFLSVSQLPAELSNFFSGLAVSRYVVFAGVVVMYVILGCLMESFSMLILTVPIIYPIIMALGFDPIWFGVIMVIMMEQALITPPVGLNVYLIQGISGGVPILTVFKGIAPFWICMMLMVVILVAFPDIALFLNNIGVK